MSRMRDALNKMSSGVFDYWCLECEHSGMVDELKDCHIRQTPIGEEDGYSPKCPNCGDGCLTLPIPKEDNTQILERMMVKTRKIYHRKLYLALN